MSLERIGLSWPLSGHTGWGIFGINLALNLARRGGPLPLLLAPPAMNELTVDQAAVIGSLADEQSVIVGQINAQSAGRAATLKEVLVLHALGNGFVWSNLSADIQGAVNVGFIFFAMVVGMAAGSGRHDMAALTTFLTCGIILVLRHLDMFPAVRSRRLLRVRVGTDDDYGAALEEVLERHADEHELLTVESVQAGLLTELSYSVRVRKDSSPMQLVSEIQRVNGNNRILLLGQTPELAGRAD